jgi:Neutral/alkaline non-lysosomal ceramidase, N-terminal
LLLLLVSALAAAPAAEAAPLRAGVGKADITPRTGYYLGGWTRQDRVAQGQHTRLWSRALVLQRGERKVALVAVDLFMVPGGLVKHVGDALASRGFSESNLLVSASHTHSGPGGYRVRGRAKQYRLTSLSFRVRPSRRIDVHQVAASPGHVAVTLGYPQPVRDVDLRYRPPSARGGVVRFRVNGETVVVRSRGTVFEVARPDGATVSVPAGAAGDRHGNRNGAAVTLP